jgi:RAD51-like protein 2
MATKYSLAAVTINQMTTKMSDNASQIVPALGESWAHAVTTRLILERQAGLTHRICRLVKSPHKACGVAQLDVRECGIRDVKKSAEQKENETPKRQRVK